MEKEFFKANEKLATGLTEEAIALYSQLLEEGSQSGAVHNNLGTAYFRDGQLGPAIFHFRKAEQARPRDGDVAFNLAHARKQSRDHIESQESALIGAVKNNYPLNLKESAYGATSALLLLTTVAIVLLFKKSDALRWVARLALFLALSLGAGVAFRLATERPFGVVTSEKVNIYSSQDVSSVLLFSLREGTEFSISRAEEGWLRLRLADGKTGWVRARDVMY